MISYIDLSNLKMKRFTIQDAQLYCQIFNINPNNIKKLLLNNNNLKNISGVSIFKNLEELFIADNDIIDLSSLKNLVNLEILGISYLKFTDESDTVEILKNLPNLNKLYCYNTFKTIDIKKELKEKGIYVFP